MNIKYASVCETGSCRTENQDSIFAETGDGWGLFVVADGMGGHSDGARASAVIAACFAAWAEENRPYIHEYHLEYLFFELRRVLSEANDEIFQYAGEEKVCGSTAVVLLISGERYILLSVGDSRCYELQKRLLKSSLCQMTADEICETPGKGFGKLVNAVGIRTPLRCRMLSGAVKKNHVFLLCSDGIYKFCSSAELLAAMRSGRNTLPEKAVEKIRKSVYANGAGDNLSVIFITVSGAGI